MNGSKLRIHFLQHVSFESLGSISEWVETNGHSLSKTFFKESPDLPNHSDYDLLIIMGGPMSIHDEAKYQWLKQEKIFVREAVENGKFVLGICLGAQIIAECLGAKVNKMEGREIGWFPIIKTNPDNILTNNFPDKFTSFHWHGEMFGIPDGAVKLFESEACNNQAFSYKNTLAFQFHLEMTEEALEKMIIKTNEPLEKEVFVNTPDEIRFGFSNLEFNNKILFGLLDKIESEILQG